MRMRMIVMSPQVGKFIPSDKVLIKPLWNNKIVCDICTDGQAEYVVQRSFTETISRNVYVCSSSLCIDMATFQQLGDYR